MFKMGLLASTAMTAVALLLSGAPDAARAHEINDANARFLCNYGFINVSWFHDGHSGEDVHIHWTHVAVPITGRGQTVQRIVIEEEKGARSADGRFTAGIYSNNASGFPGNLIAGGSATATGSCTDIAIPITPTLLQRGTKYWIMEKAREPGHVKRRLSWAVEPGAKRKGWVQQFSATVSGSYTSPWNEQTTGPYFRLR